jgi:replicative DNA helicase
MGKTAFALNIAEHIALDNHQPTAFFSLEMGKQQLAERLLSSRSGVDGQRMRRNMLGKDEFRRLQVVVSEAYESPMYIDDTPGLSVLELRAKARRLAHEKDIKAVFVDYLQLMSSPGAESRQQEVSEISRGIKALARELKVPVIALSQLNRNPAGRADNRPLLSDLRESGSIEQDADVVMMLHREEYYHKDEAWRIENEDKIGLAEVIIAKQRNGPTGIVELHFNSDTTRFGDRAHIPEPGGGGAYSGGADGGYAGPADDIAPF